MLHIRKSICTAAYLSFIRVIIDDANLYLQKLLPSQYSHTVCSYETIGDDNFKAAIKLKLSSEKEAKKWLEDFQRSSGFIWRTSKTYPNVGRYNKYRVSQPT